MNGDKLPPHDLDAEEAVIGSLLIDGTAIYRIATFLQPLDFYHEQAKWLYQACLSLYERNEAINQITVAQELARQGKLESCGGAAYLSHLIAACPTSLDIEHYAQIVYRLSVMRGLIGAADQIAAVGYESGSDVDASLSRAEDILFRLRHGQSPRDFTHIRQVLDKYFEAVSASEEEGAPQEPIPYVLSNFVGLDEFLGGFQRSDLIIVAGRPSMGKTSLALGIARNVAVEKKACVALFSLEMARESLVLRLLSSEAGVNSQKVRFGQHNEDEERRIMEATGVLSESAVYIDDSPQLRVAELRSKARRLHYEHPVDLIIVDYLQLMQGEGRGENRVQEISYISRSLKALARDLNVPVMAVSQLSRAVEWRASHVPQLSDLRESGSIEQDADVVLLIYREEWYHTEEEWQSQHPDKEYPREEADIIIAKHRNGPTGRIKLRFRHSLARFYNFTSEEPSLL
ncbi:MAG: replicative DNA helicase [Dehalococcoidales bacterium]|jgi:replicative DNA helicase|nr:replicative DNA helicase [Dehalococcoidales bacterium]MDP6448985.1 replicative DNA helicase [Dehalococcoidales bacterium]MDP6577090.1 replicative DNA helicase [Dehalococcoidales bacterium]|tara:strand:+ start:2148 stop:3524 length:1377 start_codon:yes stop_codon:yes gene_type:complete